MKHFLLLLYLISYTSGTGAITLGWFYYIKSKNLSMKYIIISDIFFTAFLFFDTLNFYTDVFISGFPAWLQIIKIAGLMFSGIGIMYFFTLSCYISMEIEITKMEKTFYLITTIIFFTLCISILFVLCQLNLISLSIALQTGFFLPNIFTSIWAVYNMLLIIKNWAKINEKIKQFVKVLVILAAVLTPLSILSNVVQYWYSFSIPIAYSPIEYFSFNLSAIIFAKRNLQEKVPAQLHQADIYSQISAPQKIFEEFSTEYNLTQRELEIIELIHRGLTNQDIAANLFISVNTSRNHIYNIYKKVGIKNRYELISLISEKIHKV